MGKLKILVVEPDNVPYIKLIEDTLEAKQELVGGYVEFVYPFNDSVALVCNEEGKLLGMPLNRSLRDENGTPYDMIAGTFFVVGLDEDSTRGLTEEEISKYESVFHEPEIPIMVDNELVVLRKSEFEKMTNGILQNEFEEPTRQKINVSNNSKYMIYQLREDLPNRRDYSFLPYKYLDADNLKVEGQNYNLVYSAERTDESLEDIFLKYQRGFGEVPTDFYGHSLSVSDVIVLEENGQQTAWYVDSMGFVEVPGFFETISPELFAPIDSSGITVNSDIDSNIANSETLKLKVMNYEGVVREIEVPEETAKIKISVVSGDEVITFINSNNEDIGKFDPEIRRYDFFDGEYVIPREHFETWNGLVSVGDTVARMMASNEIMLDDDIDI